MASKASGVQARLNQIAGFLNSKRKPQTIPWDPDCVEFPTRKEIPELPNAPSGAAWFWGKDDYLGRINLLTPTRVKLASSEIRTGELIPLNLPLDEPNPPAFGRDSFKHEVIVLIPEVAFDDKYSLNTQSGTQWDGFRHVAHVQTKTFYNNTTFQDIKGPDTNLKGSIHYMAEHGIAGRGILLDYWSYAQKKGKWYDCSDRHTISFEELQACGKDQGIDIRPESQGGHVKVGDLLIIRSGWTEQYAKKSQEESAKLALREMEQQKWAGLEASEKNIDWLHDCYFAAVAGDAPAFEAWPPEGENFLHTYLLALWGTPIGEFWDLEKLAKRCRELNRWTFFLSSSPANCKGGVGSHANAIAIL